MSVIHGHQVGLWGVLNFTEDDLEKFVSKLIVCCKQLHIKMKEPLFNESHRMDLLHNIDNLYRLLDRLKKCECFKTSGSHLELLLCVLPKEDSGYNNLKWVSETKVGIITQCCLSKNALELKDQFLANLVLKINAKLGGRNVELFKQPRCFQSKDHVMFMGADVNHPGTYDKTSDSIAAVVGTMNRPEVREGREGHREEKIMRFGSMCLNLVNAYDEINKKKPDNIVIFRDGVSTGEINMVLNKELKYVKEKFKLINYSPMITLIVAHKRHATRLFLGSWKKGNVPPGTVVDREITAPSGSDFYLCSHFGETGTSKPAHYQVLQNQINCNLEELQEMIYGLCFTSAQCTKSVSLVPPIVYANRAGLLQFNGVE